MKHSISWLRAALAPAALIPFAVACSHRQAEAPSVGNTPESQAGMSAQSGGQQSDRSGQQGTSGMSGDQGQIGQTGQTAQQGTGQGNLGDQGRPYGGQGQVGDQGQQYGNQGFGAGLGEQQGESATSEKLACDALANSAKMRVEDVQGGVSIVVTPKGGQEFATVRDDARRLENTFHGTHGAQGETCGIAELARLPSVTAQVIEGTNSMRIQLTTTNDKEVKDLRRIARDEVNSLTKGVNSGEKKQK